MANHAVLHDTYFRQFVNEDLINLVSSRIGKLAIIESKDEHMNDIPLQRWDDLYHEVMRLTRDLRKEAGEDNSLGTSVCIAKAAARIIKERSNG